MIGNGAVRSFFRSIASFSVLVYTQPMAVIRISLDSSTSEKVAGIGGTGLDLAFALYDAFRESDPIVITPPSEEALRFSGCAFFTMVFRSPVTDSMMMQYSSLPPGYSLRRLGYDAVVITGRAEHFSYLSISADDAEFLSAEGMRCTPSSVFETMARKNITDVFLSIGRAGENGILYASLQSGAASDAFSAGRTSKASSFPVSPARILSEAARPRGGRGAGRRSQRPRGE